MNGNFKVHNSYKTQPKAQMSDVYEYALPSYSSGDIKYGVPTNVLASSFSFISCNIAINHAHSKETVHYNTLAIPRSPSTRFPSSDIKML